MHTYGRINILRSLIESPSIITSKNNYIFLLGHMRSRSSLLSHVLGSHTKINGYWELHQSYRRRIDLLKMRLKIFQDLKMDLNNSYLFDKILHNHLILEDDLLEAIKPKVVFLLRNPNSTISSIIKMGLSYKDRDFFEPERAANYYIKRLAHLESYSKRLKGNYYFLESDDLINHTDKTLRKLEAYLELETPLSSHYSIFKRTSQPGYGDSSSNISVGHIVKNNQINFIQISPVLFDASWQAYEHCRSVLSSSSACVMA